MRWPPALLILFVILVVGAFARDASVSHGSAGATGTSTSLSESTSLSPSGTPTPLRSMRPDSPLIPPVSEWTTYTSESGGYTLEVPAVWEVSDSTGRGDWITIRPPVRRQADGITVSYLTYEKPEEQNLLEWLIRYEEVTFGAESPKYEYEPVVLGSTEGDSGVDALFEYVPDAPYGRGYYLTNGRLVLHIHTQGASDQQAEVLRRIAASVTFHVDAPTSILDISDPERPPVHTTIAEFDRMNQIWVEANAALAVRMNTGETPTELLTDPYVATKYEDLLERRASEIERHDRNREMMEEMLANRAPTPNPTEYQLTQEAFQVIERLYNEDVSRKATQEASKPEQTPSPVSPLPTPTPTTIPATILAEFQGRYPGLKPFVQKSWWSSVTVAMLVWYDPLLWRQTIGDSTEHLELGEDPACQLFLSNRDSAGMAYSAQWLSGQEWTVLLSWENRYGYEPIDGPNAIHALLQLPEGQEYRETNKGECQRLAEDVLDTASAVDGAWMN